MSMSNLSIDGEFRYIIQWFNEWSELQRDDFVYVFVEYLARGSSSGASDGQVNGLVNSLANAAVQDKPMSLFQCRVSSRKFPARFCPFSWFIVRRLSCSVNGAPSGRSSSNASCRRRSVRSTRRWGRRSSMSFGGPIPCTMAT